MSGVEPTVELVGEFSDPDAAAVPWAEVVRVLESSEMFLVVDGAARRSSARRPAAGDVAGQQAALLHWRS